MSKILLKINSSPSSISLVEKWIRTIANKYGIKEEVYPDILISLTEAVNNAIIHGNKNDCNKYVKLYLIIKKKGLQFKVSDQGSGFNPLTIPNPTCPENIEICGGRGVYLIKQLCDKVRFLDNGTSVEMDFYYCCL